MTNEFQPTAIELDYIKEINNIIMKDENISYIIGIDSNKNRRIFQIYSDKSTEPPTIYVLAEILKEDSKLLDDIRFEFNEEEDEITVIHKKRRWFEFW